MQFANTNDELIDNVVKLALFPITVIYLSESSDWQQLCTPHNSNCLNTNFLLNFFVRSQIQSSQHTNFCLIQTVVRSQHGVVK